MNRGRDPYSPMASPPGIRSLDSCLPPDKMRVPSAFDLWLNERMKITTAFRGSLALWPVAWLTGFVFVLPLTAQTGQLAAGVRGLATRAPNNVKIDGDLSEFRSAFC